jgi:hypothetical protein
MVANRPQLLLRSAAALLDDWQRRPQRPVKAKARAAAKPDAAGDAEPLAAERAAAGSEDDAPAAAEAAAAARNAQAEIAAAGRPAPRCVAR